MPATDLPLLRQAVRQSPVIDRDGYPYFVHPITDGVPRLEPELLEEVVEALASIVPADATLLLAPEAMAIHVAAGVAQRRALPMVVARKRGYGLEGEVAVGQSTGYSKGTLYVNDVGPDDRVAIVDDVVSTGGTLRALVDAVGRAGAVVAGVLVVLDKTPAGSLDGVEYQRLLRVGVAEGRLEVVPSR